MFALASGRRELEEAIACGNISGRADRPSDSARTKARRARTRAHTCTRDDCQHIMSRRE